MSRRFDRIERTFVEAIAERRARNEAAERERDRVFAIALAKEDRKERDRLAALAKAEKKERRQEEKLKQASIVFPAYFTKWWRAEVLPLQSSDRGLLGRLFAKQPSFKPTVSYQMTLEGVQAHVTKVDDAIVPGFATGMTFLQGSNGDWAMTMQTQKLLLAPSWSDAGRIWVPWETGAEAVLTMMRRSAAHARCAGRDGTFNIGHVQHVKLWRVENFVLWKQYLNKADELRQRHKAAAETVEPLRPPVPQQYDDSAPQILKWGSTFDSGMNEVLLWHGTSYENVQIIVNSGMDERVCNLNGIFGAGLYFAQDSCKSGQYAKLDSNDSHWFLLCRVMLGRVHKTSVQMTQARKPPGAFNSVVYDPEVGSNCSQHREFIVYDRYQAYPEFVIEARLR